MPIVFLSFTQENKMGASKWLIFFACIYLKEFESEASSWTSTSPASVKGLLGSCVVIPCSFNYPDEGNKYEFTGIWNNPNGVIFRSGQTLQQYQNRVELVGELKSKNCSLKIDPLQKSDVGPFDFRIEIKNYNSYSYKNNIAISVISEPNPLQLSVEEDIKEGQNVSAVCSVSHSCPASPPNFKWSHLGEEIHQSQQLDNAEWNTRSILSFRPTHIDHNKPLQCTVTYKGGKSQEKSKILHVKYAPLNVNIEYKVDVKEGEIVDLTCSSEAHPPVSRYEWHNETGAKISQGNLYIVSNVSRTIGAMYCAAINDEGKNVSRPVQLNVLYAPEIKTESSCSVEGNWVKCECIVDSNPASTVTFKHSDKILPGTTRDKNGFYTIKILWKDIEPSKFVQCLASNIEGKASHTLSVSHDEMMLYIFIASGAAGFLLLVILVVGLYKKCRGKPRDTSELNMSAMMTERPQQPPEKDSNRNKICDDPHSSNIYMNEDMYGNVGTDWDDQIYANV
ncbi:myelin-associated glycoprotein-like [Xiphophorus hellerii]|uniref:myelin-associated glycoprotein-like n=1 Tax=Xiphophorus hellerii TaxID=8084 RepID=UPI0013B42901|nr:myelin-associated glycoprotein-like [Xiphophorus hellerii]